MAARETESTGRAAAHNPGDGALDAAGIHYELVISDNASTDGTADILARLAEGRPQVRLFRQPRDVGAYPNILSTLRLARGELVVSIADDDLAISEQLIAYARRMADDPGLVMIHSPWLRADEVRGHGARRAWCVVGGAPEGVLDDGQDIVCDLALTMERFPLFKTG